MGDLSNLVCPGASCAWMNRLYSWNESPLLILMLMMQKYSKRKREGRKEMAPQRELILYIETSMYQSEIAPTTCSAYAEQYFLWPSRSLLSFTSLSRSMSKPALYSFRVMCPSPSASRTSKIARDPPPPVNSALVMIPSPSTSKRSKPPSHSLRERSFPALVLFCRFFWRFRQDEVVQADRCRQNDEQAERCRQNDENPPISAWRT